ncbi:MAG TPA: GNAT family N-acetyltransferase [Vicinamibacterales bacterium]|nr:GNAT family N-acetyltransferase [Vicinamibacterales bacterium]
MPTTVRQAQRDDVHVVEELLIEAARWVDALGEVMWEEGELSPGRIAAEVEKGQFFLAVVDGEIGGAIRFQLEDRLFWPDLAQSDSAFVHRLVVGRRHKGLGVSTVLLQWAVDRARAMGKRYLRLDCDASRPKLRALYERFGFRVHSFRQVGAYYVARYEFPLERV